MTIGDQVAEGDEFVHRWTARGTYDGEFLGIEPPGRGVEFTGIGIMRVRDARFVEGWTVPDVQGALRQPGVAPQPVRAG